jgi:hypothetical protein
LRAVQVSALDTTVFATMNMDVALGCTDSGDHLVAAGQDQVFCSSAAEKELNLI